MDKLAFIWDMDGTLVDSYAAIVPAVRDACARFGLFVSDEHIHEEIIRTSGGTFLEQLTSGHGMDLAPVRALFDELNDTRIDSVCAMPNAEETLSALSKAGHRNFVYTHRKASSHVILRQTGLAP